MKRWWKNALVVSGGVAGALVLYGGVSLLLPPVIPQAAPDSAGTISTVRAHKVSKTHRVTPQAPAPAAGTGDLVSMQYSGTVYQNALARAKKLGFTLLLPTSAYSGTTLEESYVHGDDLDLEFSNMLAVESAAPVTSTFQPDQTTNVSLPDGVSAQWLLIYGVGGPANRLIFQQSGTYVRLQLFRAYVPATASAFETIGGEFGAFSG